MPLKGDLTALGGFAKKLQKLPEASAEIALALAPKVAGLVDETFAAQASPSGVSWTPTKSGEPAFAGGETAGRVLSRLVGKATVSTTLLYPLHFHQDGTHVVGRKRGAAIRRGFIAGRVAVEMKRWAGAPRKRKNETEEQYQARLEYQDARKSARDDARSSAKKAANDAVAQARAAGGWHDPPRPMIPDEGDPIPDTWTAVILATAKPIMLRLGATARP